MSIHFQIFRGTFKNTDLCFSIEKWAIPFSSLLVFIKYIVRLCYTNPNSPGRADWLRAGTEAEFSTSISFSKGLFGSSAMTDILLLWNLGAMQSKKNILLGSNSTVWIQDRNWFSEVNLRLWMWGGRISLMSEYMRSKQSNI